MGGGISGKYTLNIGGRRDLVGDLVSLLGEAGRLGPKGRWV